MSFWTLLVLGLIAGGTILIGLLLGRLRGLSDTLRTALSMLAAGILVFLLIEIIGQATNQTATSVSAAVAGMSSGGIAGVLTILLLGGLLLGFFSLVVVERTLIRQAAAVSPARLSLMIAVAIGLHNLSEGLAIGHGRPRHVYARYRVGYRFCGAQRDGGLWNSQPHDASEKCRTMGNSSLTRHDRW